MEHNGNYSGPKDSKKDDDSDNISPFSGHVHSVNKNDNGSNTDCGESNIKDSDVPTAVTNDEKENARKIAAFVEKVIHNEMIQDDKMEWPLCLLIEHKRSVEISQENLKNMILNKAAEVISTHMQSHMENQMSNLSKRIQEQRSYQQKYKQLLSYVNDINSELELLNRVPNNEVKLVRNAKTNVEMPTNSKKTL